MGVQGICQMMTLDVSASVSRSSAEPDGEPVAVHFGSLEFIRSVVPRDSPYQKQLDRYGGWTHTHARAHTHAHTRRASKDASEQSVV